MPINLTGILEKTARHFPNTQAVVYERQSLSFLEFYNRVRKLGSAFRALGVKNDDRIAVLSVFCPVDGNVLRPVLCQCDFCTDEFSLVISRKPCLHE